MRTTWSGLAKDWQGFHLEGYSLGEQALKVDLKCVEGDQADLEAANKSLGKILEDLKGSPFTLSKDSMSGFRISVDGRSMRISGSTFNVDLARIILELISEGRPLYRTRWFFYSHASCLTDPHERYEFFVADGEEIVRESVSLSDYHGNGFDPGVFESFEDSEPTWSDEEGWRSAVDASFYRKFYSTTRTGQLMLLRPDNPPLHKSFRSENRDNHPPVVASFDLRKPLWLIAIILGILALFIVAR